jgi:hypothetical protein
VKIKGTFHHVCPIRAEDSRPKEKGRDLWTTGYGLAGRQGLELSCNYCGSLHPGTFMAWVRDGAMLVPTETNYRVYVKCPYPDKREGQVITTHRPYGQYDSVFGMEAKFHFQHLELEQRLEFVSLLNEKALHLTAPGFFYNLPFFIKSVLPDRG